MCQGYTVRCYPSTYEYWDGITTIIRFQTLKKETCFKCSECKKIVDHLTTKKSVMIKDLGIAEYSKKFILKVVNDELTLLPYVKEVKTVSYCEKNFKFKKALKDAVARGDQLRCFQPGLGPDLTNYTGEVYLEGPHYPMPHRWYATAKLENGIIKEVK